LETIDEEISPDKTVKNIVDELNLEHQGSGNSDTPSPVNNEEKTDGGPSLSQMEPQRTSEFEQTNLDEGNFTVEQNNTQDKKHADVSMPLSTPEAHNTDDIVEEAEDVRSEKSQPHEEEHSATNDPPAKQIVLADDHTMDTDEFLNSSGERAHSAKTGNSHDDEGTSVSKPPPEVYLPRGVLQGLKDLTPDEALDKLLSSFGAYIPTAADREKALQLEQAEHEERFRREVIEGDMLGLLERDPTIYFNIKALFNQLQTPGTRANYSCS
jgi:hypothetical protein